MKRIFLMFIAAITGACAGSRYIDTSDIAASYIKACMGKWVYVPASGDAGRGPFSVTINPDFTFRAEFSDAPPIEGSWYGFGTLDAGIRMDHPQGANFVLVDCPGDPEVAIDTDSYKVGQPSGS